MNALKVLVNNYEYCKYSSIAGYSKVKDIINENDSDSVKASAVLRVGLDAVFFDRTFTAKSLVVPRDGHCMVGFSIMRPNVDYKLLCGDSTIMTGKSNTYRSPGVFRPPYKPRSDKWSDVEDFRVDPDDNVRIELRSDCVVGRYYIPFTDSLNLRIELSEESDIIVYYMLMRDADDLRGKVHRILLNDKQYVVDGGYMYESKQ
jgi:hypothetical protein